VTTTATVLRTARSAALVAVSVAAEGRTCLDVRVWFVRSADTANVGHTLPAPPPIPEEPGELGIGFGYGGSIDWRFIHGGMVTAGPAAVWARPHVSLLPGQRADGLALTVLIADSGGGVSAELDWASWSFLNVDLDVHLARPVEGEWILLDSRTQLGGSGSGLARSTLSDAQGVVGSGLQTLVLQQLAPSR
jgi:hypothetical protein